MPRVKLKELLEYEYSIELPIRIYDLNYGRHVGNAEFINLIHEARVQLLQSEGLSEFNLGDNITGIIMSDIQVNYKIELFINETIVIDSHVDEVSDTSFRIYHRVKRNGEVAALVETGFVGYDYRKSAVVPLPESFKKLYA